MNIGNNQGLFCIFALEASVIYFMLIIIFEQYKFLIINTSLLAHRSRVVIFNIILSHRDISRVGVQGLHRLWSWKSVRKFNPSVILSYKLCLNTRTSSNLLWITHHFTALLCCWFRQAMCCIPSLKMDRFVTLKKRETEADFTIEPCIIKFVTNYDRLFPMEEFIDFPL